MKNTINKITKTAVMLILMVAFTNTAMAKNKTIKIKTSAICDMCKDRIELVVNNLEGVKKSLLTVETKVLIVKFNTDKISESAILFAISDAGYDADDVPANAAAYQVLPGCCKKDGKCDMVK